MSIPPAELLAIWGMASIGLFAVWKLQVAPRLAKPESPPTA